MDNTILWVGFTVSFITNFVVYYLFWRAIQENEKLVNESAKLTFENLKLKADAEIREREESAYRSDRC